MDTVLRSDDPRCAELEASGWALVATSWGARLRVTPELFGRLRRLVSRVEGAGRVVRELGAEDAEAVRALDAGTAGDYPAGLAVFHEPLDRDAAEDLFTRGRVFGVEYAGTLVAVTVTEVVGRSRVETGFTAVHPDQRGTGLATAVKAASVLAHAVDGATLFGTGGAGVNEASLAMNRTVGYQITETWHTYRPPSAVQAPPSR